MHREYNGRYPKALRAWARKKKRTLESIAKDLQVPINYFYNFGDRIGPKTIKKIILLTKGEVTAKDLRPDLFG